MTEQSAPEPHPLADAARTLFKELQEAGKPVVGVGIGEGRIFLRASVADPGAPAEYRGHPVTIVPVDGIKP